MISLKDYAGQKNVSYEAIRKQVSRYKEDLEGHIIMDGRQQFLDDEAVAFLDDRRQKNPVIIYQQSKDEEIAALKEEREQLLMKVSVLSERVADLTQFKLETIEQRQLLEATTAQQETRKRELDDREQQMEERISEARREAVEATEAALKEKLEQELAKEAEKTAEEHREREKAEQDKEEALKEKKALRDELDAYKALPWYKKIFR